MACRSLAPFGMTDGIQLPRSARDDRIPFSAMGWTFRLVLGVVLIGLGLFVAVRPLFTHNGVLTSARWLDLTFAFVFTVRGVMNVKSALRRRGGMNR